MIGALLEKHERSRLAAQQIGLHQYLRRQYLHLDAVDIVVHKDGPRLLIRPQDHPLGIESGQRGAAGHFFGPQIASADLGSDGIRFKFKR